MTGISLAMSNCNGVNKCQWLQGGLFARQPVNQRDEMQSNSVWRRRTDRWREPTLAACTAIKYECTAYSTSRLDSCAYGFTPELVFGLWILSRVIISLCRCFSVRWNIPMFITV